MKEETTGDQCVLGLRDQGVRPQKGEGQKNQRRIHTGNRNSVGPTGWEVLGQHDKGSEQYECNEHFSWVSNMNGSHTSREATWGVCVEGGLEHRAGNHVA